VRVDVCVGVGLDVEVEVEVGVEFEIEIQIQVEVDVEVDASVSVKWRRWRRWRRRRRRKKTTFKCRCRTWCSTPSNQHPASNTATRRLRQVKAASERATEGRKEGTGTAVFDAMRKAPGVGSGSGRGMDVSAAAVLCY
jgi:hypothetical protein